MAEHALDGRVAVVTGGGGGGIGGATAVMLAEAGAAVAVADLNAATAEATADAIRQAGGEAFAVTVDVTDPASLQALAAEIDERFGRLDVVVCNAGLARFPRPAVTIDPAEFELIFKVNVLGVWLTVCSAVPLLERSGGGSVIITGSIMGERTRPGFAAYASSKAASNHLARTLALELAASGIRVNAVAPVATDTPMLPMFLGPDQPDEMRKQFIAGIPLGRLAEPSDIASAITFLASDASAFITGVVVPVDGGRSV